MYRELSSAIAFAAEVHEKQFDMAGKSYILHPLRVMRLVQLATDNIKAAIVAIDHDTIEDGFANDIEHGFVTFQARVTPDVEVVTALRLLTKTKGMDYFDYIRAIAKNDIAKIVKIADLRDNSDITRLKGIREKDLVRMKKYNASFLYLTGQTDKLLDLA